MTEPTHKKPHHHGNLRQTLIDAGIALLEEGSAESLTLRKCAARAGVSHAAPAHHFDGLLGLKAAIAEQGFDIFSRYMLEAAESGPQTPRARLKGICTGYLRFGLDHPALFRLIFSFDAKILAEKELDPGNAQSYMILRDCCAPFVPKDADPVVIETQVWALIHGYTSLVLDGRFYDPRTKTLGQGPFDAVMTLLDHIGQPAP